MAVKRVLLLLGSDRHSFPLIQHLESEGERYGWKLRIGCLFDAAMAQRMRDDNPARRIDSVHLSKMKECDREIRKADLVVAMATDSQLLDIADRCILYRKSLISPGGLNRQMVMRKAAARERGVLLLMDCGFSPGLDHITAKKAIDNIHAKGGKIESFKTFTGNFISGDPAGNVLPFLPGEPVEWIVCGRQNNRHLQNNCLQYVPYHRLFERPERIGAREFENMVGIPVGDALYYRKIYDLAEAHTVMKGRLLPEAFNRTWNMLVRLGLTENNLKIDTGSEAFSKRFIEAFLPWSASGSLGERLQEYSGGDGGEMETLKWLGLFNTCWPGDAREVPVAVVIQHLLEKKLLSCREQGDHVMMVHQLAYAFRDENYELTATLVSKGSGQRESALARAIGLTCGAAAKCAMLGSITAKGLHTPVVREIYDPILNELSDLGIAFQVEEKMVSALAPVAP